MKLRKFLILSLLPLLASGCDAGGFQTMGAGEYGVVFNALPRWGILGPMKGGVREHVLQQGEMEFIWPWQTLTVYDGTQQSISWGTLASGEGSASAEYVETRSVDGNEVGLAIEVQYRVDPVKLPHIVQKVGDMERIRTLVSAVARADIRTHMNVLTTSDFFDQVKRQAAVERVQFAMETRLVPEGIIVDRVRFIDYKFERAGLEGQPNDDSYQRQIDETQATIQQTEQEAKKRAALIQEKGQEFEAAEGERKKTAALARGYDRQARIRGDSYLEQRKNEAAQLETVGMNEVEGMKKRIEALSGPGGEALLRLEIAKQLTKRAPRFVLLNSGGSSSGGTGGGRGSVEVNKIDTNELVRQMGLFAAGQEALKDEPKPAETTSPAVSAPLPTPGAAEIAK